MRTRAWLALVLALLLAFPATASAISGAKVPDATSPAVRTLSGGALGLLFSSDDDIPGVPIPASPFAGAVDAITDPDDVYAIVLNAGDSLQVSMTGPAGTDFDLYLYRNNTGSIADGYILASSSDVGSEEMFSWTPWSDETVYLDVYAVSGTGAYTITWQIQAKAADDDVPGVPIPASPIEDFVDRGTDTADVFAVTLAAGERIGAELLGESGDFDLELYAPATPSIWDGSTWVLEGSYGDEAAESISHVAAAAGTYYLVVTAFDGGDDYTLTWGTHVAEADDDVPGVPLPASPVIGSMSVSDPDDVYSIELQGGQTFVVSMTGPPEAEADFDLYLYPPGTGSVSADPNVASSTHSDSAESITYVAAQTGTYYVDVCRYGGAGTYTLTWSIDGESPGVGVIAVAGTDRIGTAIEGSKLAYPTGADTVVIATALNWPDALGGSALAGVLDAPILLTYPGALPSTVLDEIRRLGADEAVILGGEGAVSLTVETALKNELGTASGVVTRIAGGNRYTTADAVATEVMDILGAAYDGVALVATGGDFPDALAAAPLAAANGWPLFLANPASGLSAASKAAMSRVESVLILGGTGAVSVATESYLNTTYGDADVDRLAGGNRYSTAVDIASYGVTHAGLSWDRVGIATGENYPDALAGGVLQGKVGSVMLLTPSTTLSLDAAAALTTHKGEINTVTFFGGEGAVYPAVRTAVSAQLE